MDANKCFYNIDEQIEHLISKGLVIKNAKNAKGILQKTSYYEIINGYRKPFEYQVDPKKFLKGTTFEEIYSLYFFDKRLRDIILPYLFDAESIIKHTTNYNYLNFKDKSGKRVYEPEDYLKIKSYDNRRLKNAVRNISNLHKLISSNFDLSDSIKHYLTTYSFVPLWVLQTKMTFGDINKFYYCLNQNVRQSIAKIFALSDKELSNVISILAKARNCCAHKDRLYCLDTKTEISAFCYPKYSKVSSIINKTINNKNLFGVFICLKTIIPAKSFTAAVNAVQNEIESLKQKMSSNAYEKVIAKMGLSASDIQLIDLCDK